MTCHSAVVAVEAFDAAALRDGFAAIRSGTAAALRVRHVVSGAAASHVCDQVAGYSALTNHADVDGLKVLGISHFQAARDAALADRYHAEGSEAAARLRRLSQPYGSPYDVALGLFVDTWLSGCSAMSLADGTRRLAPFTIRVYTDGVGIEPHQDSLRVEAADDPRSRTISEQFGANLFLSIPESGGELLLWGDDEDYDRHDLAAGPRIVDPDTLPEPLLIHPEQGDLIVFRTRRVHAVGPTRGATPRVTLSFFVGVEGDTSPLRIWA